MEKLLLDKLVELKKTDKLDDFQVIDLAMEITIKNQADPKFDEFKRQTNKYYSMGMQLAASTKVETIEEPIQLILIAFPAIKKTEYPEMRAPQEMIRLKMKNLL